MTHELDVEKLPSGIGGFKSSLVIKDEATFFCTFFPSTSKDSQSAVDAMIHHFGADLNKAKMFYSDGATAFKKMLKCLVLLQPILLLILLLQTLGMKPL